ncbi:MAG: hypothetical protein AAF349_09875 [Cyanobacteria bacterium P01_A01_bin.68]
MTMEHKAFIFDYNTFIKELADILDNALVKNKIHELIAFIEKNLSDLKHPDEGETLNYSWKKIIEIGDVDEYADIAITKYYNPEDNIGLSYNWMQLDDLLLQELNLEISPLLGTVFGSSEVYFNPGKQGSYFQSPEKVRENFELINSLSNEKLHKLSNIDILKNMFLDALVLQKGLYLTF